MKEIISFVKENTWLSGIDHGWGNGYVCIPPGHKYHEVNYDDIPIDIHGGLTFSEHAKACNDVWTDGFPINIPKDYWVVGFDTAHLDDTSADRPKEWVEKETDRLKAAIQKATS